MAVQRAPAAAGPLGPVVYLHLLALATLAVGRPVCELLAATPEFFAARGGGRADVLVTLALLLLVAPLPWLGAAFAARRWWGGGAAARAVATLAGSLVALVALRGMALAVVPGIAALVASVAAGALAGWAYLRSSSARFFATCLLPAVVVVPALFVLDPAIARRLAAPPPPVPLHASGAKVPVVVVVLDELPLPSLVDAAGGIDARRFPHLAALAAQSTWFRNAAAPSGDTATALPAILSGRVQRDGDALQLQRNLFTLLGDYPTYSVEFWSALCPPGHNRLVAQRRPQLAERTRRLLADLPVVWLELVAPAQWRRHLPPLAGGWDRFAAGGWTAAARKRPSEVGHFARRPPLASFLASIAPSERALYFGHLLFPHVPWEHLPSGRTYACRPECFPPVPIEAERWRAAQLYQRYLLQLGYTDGVVGEIVERLRRAGLYDRALVVLLADHGAAFRPGLPPRSTEPATLGEVLSVPLLVKRPGQRTAATVDELVTTADLLATVADVLDVRAPWPLAGRSLFAGGRGAPVYVSTGGLVPVPAELPARREAARRQLAALAGDAAGDAGAPLDAWRIGPLPQLLGAAPGAAGEAPDLELALDDPERLRDVDPAAAELPVFVSGRLTGARAATDGCCTLAVAVNGTLWATTRAFRTAQGELRLAAMVPERSLRPGDNELAIYAVDADGTTLRLVPRRR